MVGSLILIHLGVAVLAPFLARALGQRAFLVAAVAPAASLSWLVAIAPDVLGGTAIAETVPWIPGLGVSLSFRIGLVQWVLALIVVVVVTDTCDTALWPTLPARSTAKAWIV